MKNETKLDASFPVIQFCINGFSTPYRLDRNRNGEGIIIYVREYINYVNKNVNKTSVS